MAGEDVCSPLTPNPCSHNSTSLGQIPRVPPPEPLQPEGKCDGGPERVWELLWSRCPHLANVTKPSGHMKALCEPRRLLGPMASLWCLCPSVPRPPLSPPLWRHSPCLQSRSPCACSRCGRDHIPSTRAAGLQLLEPRCWHS